MGLFGSSKPTISKREFQKEVRGHLFAKGFTSKELNEIEEIFRGDLEDKSSSSEFVGITKEEAEAGIAWMRKNQGIHKLSEKKIDELEEVLNKLF